MEGNNLIRKQPFIPHSSRALMSPLGIHRNSQAISKNGSARPKIRIIHIVAPEIIKTDVENFRELVQRLTGKPPPADQRTRKSKRVARTNPRRSSPEDPERSYAVEKPVQVEVLRSTFLGEKKIKEEETMWSGANSGGFLSGFADFDGFIQELGEEIEFPLLLPMEPNSSYHPHHHMHGLI